MAARSLTRWNWQRPDWPRFRWDIPRLARAEECFAREAGVFLGVFQHLDGDDRDRLVVESLTEEALTTSAIEGEVLDRASVQSSIRKHLGLAADRRIECCCTRARADTGPDQNPCRSSPVPSTLLKFTSRLRLQCACTRKWRRSSIGSRALRPAPGTCCPPLTRAGTAHLYFVSVHPFEDGNGRVGRAVAEKALSQAMGQPLLTALAATIMSRRKAYYDALEAANKYNEVTAWLRWFAATAIDAQRQAVAAVEFLVEKARLLTRLRGRLNPRQEKTLLRMLREGPAGFRGGLSAGNYMRITGASPATATRDLAGMVTLGALSRTGEVRHARYWATIAAKTPHPYQD